MSPSHGLVSLRPRWQAQLVRIKAKAVYGREESVYHHPVVKTKVLHLSLQGESPSVVPSEVR